jgi:hypothetical protein
MEPAGESATTLERIVSGGQTGVDRGALDAALEHGFPCGGWCPRGRLAEDGEIPQRYPLVELDGGYAERTLRNVLDSDGTAVLHRGELEGGTRQTVLHCEEHGRPYCTLDAARVPPHEAGRALARFVERHAIRVLNVAGPRASKWPEAHEYARAAIGELLRRTARSTARS